MYGTGVDVGNVSLIEAGNEMIEADCNAPSLYVATASAAPDNVQADFVSAWSVAVLDTKPGSDDDHTEVLDALSTGFVSEVDSDQPDESAILDSDETDEVEMLEGVSLQPVEELDSDHTDSVSALVSVQDDEDGALLTAVSQLVEVGEGEVHS